MGKVRARAHVPPGEACTHGTAHVTTPIVLHPPVAHPGPRQARCCSCLAPLRGAGPLHLCKLTSHAQAVVFLQQLVPAPCRVARDDRRGHRPPLLLLAPATTSRAYRAAMALLPHPSGLASQTFTPNRCDSHCHEFRAGAPAVMLCSRPSVTSTALRTISVGSDRAR